MDKLRILVVDGDPMARAALAARLEGHAVEHAAGPAEARGLLESGSFDLAFVDLELGEARRAGEPGLIPLAAAKGVHTVMLGRIAEGAVGRAYGLGGDDFHAKDGGRDGVDRILRRFVAGRDLIGDELFSERFVTEDPQTRATVSVALKYAVTDLPVMILGPAGSGKSLLARVFHDRSRRAGRFVAIDCAACPEDVLEAELFGRGRLLQARGGTLFLDEIGALSPPLQARLLETIEDRRETSLFRLITATREDPGTLLDWGRLLPDFLRHARGLTVTLPPLARRGGDVLPLLSSFTRGRPPALAPEARRLLLEHPWPGNVRELKMLADLLVAGPEAPVDAQTAAHLLARGAGVLPESGRARL